MGLIQQFDTRRLWLAVWLFAGIGALVDVLIGGAVPLTVAAAAFFGLGGGVELTLFAQRRFGRLMPHMQFAAIEDGASAHDEYHELLDGLRRQGLTVAEARRAIAGIPSGLALEEGMFVALRRHGDPN